MDVAFQRRVAGTESKSIGESSENTLFLFKKKPSRYSACAALASLEAAPLARGRGLIEADALGYAGRWRKRERDARDSLALGRAGRRRSQTLAATIKGLLVPFC